MNLFSNNHGDYASIQEIRALQEQIDILKQLVDYNHKAIEAFLQMFEEHNTKLTAIQNRADCMWDSIASSSNHILDLELRMQKLE